MLLLRPPPPAAAVAAVARQWYDPAVERTTLLKENATDSFLSDEAPSSTTTPSFTSSKVTGGVKYGATQRKVTRELR